MLRISSILATRRPWLIPAALAMFEAQDYPEKELIVVDDADLPVGDLPAGVLRFTAPARAVLGTKLNAGIALSSGTLIHKWDDDDLYAPGFLTRAAQALAQADFTCWSRHLVSFEQGTTSETRLISQCRLGGSFVFRRALWQRCPFRDQPRNIDVDLLQDVRRRAGFRMVDIEDSPELFTYVRHGANISAIMITTGRPELSINARRFDMLLRRSSIPFKR